MSDTPINLNRVRKARARDAARKTADENAVKFGQTKAVRNLEKAKQDKARKALDASRRDEGA